KWRSVLMAQGSTLRYESLATLGDSLALSHWSMSARGLASSKFDVGPYEIEYIAVTEVDAEGRGRRDEDFGSDRLGDAIVGLYERYAELLPDGPVRTRAATTAHSVAALLGPAELDRLAEAFVPAMVVIDHRMLGTWSARGADEHLQHWRSWLELVDITIRLDDIPGLRPDALLCRATGFGTDRAGGGAWEVQSLPLFVFAADGHVTRIELFDVDREVAALARFDELGPSSVEVPTAASRAARIETAATRLVDRLMEAWEARDWERVAAAYAPGFRLMDRRRMLHLELDRDGWLDNLRY